MRWCAPDPRPIAPEVRIALLERAAHQRPGSADHRVELGRALLATGAHDEALAAFRTGLTLDPSSVGANCGIARTLLELGRTDGALDAADRALVLDPDELEALSLRAAALELLGRPDEASTACRRLLAHRPGDDRALARLASLLFAEDAHEAVLSLCDEILDAAPGNTMALAVKVAALQAVGDHRQADELLGHDRFLRAADLPQPPSFSSLEALNDELAHCITEELPLQHEDQQKATRRGGKLTGLHRRSEPAIVDLLHAVRSAVDGYVADLPAGIAHPFAAARPRQARLKAWTVVFGADGFEDPHLHPTGWLSGVYYVRVPDITAPDGAAPAGSIQFGVPPSRFASPRAVRPVTMLDPVLEPVTIRPYAGLCLLFPSYYYHRSWPTGCDGPRISVAFDVCPAD